MTEHFERARELFFEGNAHLEAGRPAEAERCYAASLEALPGRASTLTNLGAVRLSLGRAADAVPVLRQAVAIESDNFEAWGHLAVALGELGEPAQALDADERALALDADSVAVWRHRGLMQQALQRDEDALASFATVVRLAPTQAEPWLLHGETLIRLRRAEEALASFERALAIDSDIAHAWGRVGALCKELGRDEEAVDALERALTLGGDADLNRFLLASITGRKAPPRPPELYVRTLFDAYADDFDTHLVEVLNYHAHETLIEGLAKHAPARTYEAALDLGCGTGLCAALLQPLARVVDGVDLSARMIERAQARGIYRTLTQADLVEHLARTRDAYDLAVAADVMLYVGDLAGVFAGVQQALRPGGVFAFTLEQADEAEDVVLLPRLAYAHSERHVRELAPRHGLQVLHVGTGPIREDQGTPIPGLYVYLVRD